MGSTIRLKSPKGIAIAAMARPIPIIPVITPAQTSSAATTGLSAGVAEAVPSGRGLAVVLFVRYARKAG